MGFNCPKHLRVMIIYRVGTLASRNFYFQVFLVRSDNGQDRARHTHASTSHMYMRMLFAIGPSNTN